MQDSHPLQSLSKLHSNEEDAFLKYFTPIVDISQVIDLFGHPWEYKPMLPQAILCTSDMLTAYPISTEDSECRCSLLYAALSYMSYFTGLNDVGLSGINLLCGVSQS